ncbi:hypothetical protein [Nonomuraea endophytica]|uniref:Uncharacterized protein n=1 Tax=Nonomuraea endophytica TaxID=714136 RepID=A0A7W8AEX0_9ACTN|nr:hypothetical protein [Nonomuraea endophytica]MBB5085052.1 hypothetical protein [Nonomuraea endophytica]
MSTSPTSLPGVHHDLVASYTALTALTKHLAQAAGLPAVMLVADPDQPSGVAVERTDEDSPIPILTVGEHLLHGDADTPVGRIAAGTLAYALVSHEWQPTAWQRWTGRLTMVAFTVTIAGLLIALTSGSVRTLLLGSLAWSVGALADLALQRRGEYGIDRAAVRLLEQAGLNGFDCMHAMLVDLSERESAFYQRLGWIFSTVPPAAARVRALAVPSRYAPDRDGSRR